MGCILIWAGDRVIVTTVAGMERPRKAAANPRADERIVFTAHSLPSRVIDSGDVYATEVAETARGVAAQAGITNARPVLADWLAAKGISGDVSLASSVTYFVHDIVSFIEKMAAASRRRRARTLPIKAVASSQFRQGQRPGFRRSLTLPELITDH